MLCVCLLISVAPYFVSKRIALVVEVFTKSAIALLLVWYVMISVLLWGNLA